MNEEISLIGGKTYIKCKVVPVVSDQPTQIQRIGSSCDFIDFGKSELIDDRYKWINVYITSLEIIKESDWYYSTVTKEVKQCSKEIATRLEKEYAEVKSIWFKVIASTDSCTGLSRPSNYFIQAYCKQGGIENILVEVEPNKCIHSECARTTCDCGLLEYRIKLSPDNTITIKKVQDNSTQQAALDYCRKVEADCFNDALFTIHDLDKAFQEGAIWKANHLNK